MKYLDHCRLHCTLLLGSPKDMCTQIQKQTSHHLLRFTCVLCFHASTFPVGSKKAGTILDFFALLEQNPVVQGTLFQGLLFWCEPFLSLLIKLVTILLLFSVLVFWPRGMWDLSSLPGTEPASSALEGKILTTGPLREVPTSNFLMES